MRNLCSSHPNFIFAPSPSRFRLICAPPSVRPSFRPHPVLAPFSFRSHVVPFKIPTPSSPHPYPISAHANCVLFAGGPHGRSSRDASPINLPPFYPHAHPAAVPLPLHFMSPLHGRPVVRTCSPRAHSAVAPAPAHDRQFFFPSLNP